MAIKEEKKKELIAQYRQHKNDSGSPEIQIALLTERINSLSGHLSKNPKDHQSQVGLLNMVGQRKSLTQYLRKTNQESYRRIIDQLSLRN